MIKLITIFLYYLLLWYIISNNPGAFFICSGLICSALIALLSSKYIPKHTSNVILLPMLKYIAKLGMDIIMSSINVLKSIWSFSEDKSSGLMEIPLSSGSGDLHTFIYGNYITLTPGTYTIGVREKTLLVHALDLDDNEELKSGTLDKDTNLILKDI